MCIRDRLSRLGDLITWASYAIAALIIIGRLTLYFSHLPGPVEWLSAGTYKMCIRDSPERRSLLRL